MPMNHDYLARAFNQGSDARLRGRHLAQCPHDGIRLKKYWRMGWQDVDQHWGEWRKNGSPRLPEASATPAE